MELKQVIYRAKIRKWFYFKEKKELWYLRSNIEIVMIAKIIIKDLPLH